MLGLRSFGELLDLARGKAPTRRGSGKADNAPARTFVATLADLDASTGAGTEVALGGHAISINPTSAGTVALEVAFDYRAGDAQKWVPLSTSCAARKADGTPFAKFYVRRLPLVPSNTDRVAIDVDPDALGSVVFHPRTPNVDPTTGAMDVVQKVVRASDSVIDTVEGADGTTASRAIPGVAVKVGAGFLPALGTAAGRVQTAPIASQEGVAAGAGAVGATTQRVTHASDDPAVTSLATIVTNTGTLAGVVSAARAAVNLIAGQVAILGGIGDSAANVVRVVDATCPAATSSQATAAAASASVVAANANRKSVTLINQHATDAFHFNFGGAAVVATHARLKAGASITLTTRQAIHAIRGAAADVTIDVIEESYA